MRIPDDVTRCPGTDHQQCHGCRRREPVNGGIGSYISPDPMEITRVGYCAHRIPPREELELMVMRGMRA